MKDLTYTDIGKWIKGELKNGGKILGRIKSYDNSKKIAWVISEGANKKGNDWKDNTSYKIDYSTLTFTDAPISDKK